MGSVNKIQDFVKNIQAKDPLLVASEKKLKKLMPTIQQLNYLEVNAQNQYLNIPLQFQNIFGGNNNNNINDTLGAKRKKKVHRAGKKKNRGGRKKKKKEVGPAKG